MTTIVKKAGDGWQIMSGVQNEAVIGAWHDTRTVIYHDGRPPEEEPCEPYPVREQVDFGKVPALLAEGVWTQDDLDKYGLVVADPFVLPEGKRIAGPLRIVANVENGRPLEDYPLADVPPPPELTLDEKLANAGLSEGDFDALVARAVARQSAAKR